MVLTNDIVFKSTVSRWIAGLYWSIIIFLGVLFIGILILNPITFFQIAIFVIVFFMVFLIIIATIVRAYRLIFIISNDRLILAGLLKKHEVMYSDIKEVKKIPIPFGFRLYGASFLGGRYYFPGVGNATVAMSNFTDGVLISTKKGYHYVITPQNPGAFIEGVKKHIS
jgi:hypothetical protein